MSNYYQPFSLRISEELLEELKRLAALHKRSANKEMEYALECYVNAQNAKNSSKKVES